jgi:hypothetical protein
MNGPRWFRRKTLRIFGGMAGLYVCCWFVTHFAGVPSLWRAVTASMPVTSSFAYTDVPRRVRGGTDGPIYFCRATAYAPFLVRADYRWRSGPLSGSGRSALYLWFFGYTSRVRELEHWAS